MLVSYRLAHVKEPKAAGWQHYLLTVTPGDWLGWVVPQLYKVQSIMLLPFLGKTDPVFPMGSNVVNTELDVCFSTYLKICAHLIPALHQ